MRLPAKVLLMISFVSLIRSKFEFQYPKLSTAVFNIKRGTSVFNADLSYMDYHRYLTVYNNHISAWNWTHC